MSVLGVKTPHGVGKPKRIRWDDLDGWILDVHGVWATSGLVFMCGGDVMEEQYNIERTQHDVCSLTASSYTKSAGKLWEVC